MAIFPQHHSKCDTLARAFENNGCFQKAFLGANLNLIILSLSLNVCSACGTWLGSMYMYGGAICQSSFIIPKPDKIICCALFSLFTHVIFWSLLCSKLYCQVHITMSFHLLFFITPFTCYLFLEAVNPQFCFPALMYCCYSWNFLQFVDLFLGAKCPELYATALVQYHQGVIYKGSIASWFMM